MIRNQISLGKEEYELAKKAAAAQGVSVSEFIRRNVCLLNDPAKSYCFQE